MNKIFGFIVVSVLSIQAVAFEELASPPFSFMMCKTENLNIRVKIQNYRAEGSGSAIVYNSGEKLVGQWQWEAEPEGTRLTGYYHLYVQAKGPNGPFSMRTLYDGYNGKLGGGWLTMPGISEPVHCEVEVPEIQNSCQAEPSDCKSKRYYCACVDGKLTCA